GRRARVLGLDEPRRGRREVRSVAGQQREQGGREERHDEDGRVTLACFGPFSANLDRRSGAGCRPRADLSGSFLHPRAPPREGTGTMNTRRTMFDANDLSPELLAAQGRALRGLARSLLGDEHAADDVVQDTWLACLRHPGQLPERISAWLTTVTRNRALQRVR